jgi:predicted glutamine amidotransferase
MCGIIGIIGNAPVTPLLVEALKRLEYRGYDSAGVATLINGHIDRRRAEGKLVNLEARLAAEPLAGTIGIGHTRWATHGKPSERNAHPIATDRVAIVHNGIIENFQELKDELLAEGRTFESDTDTEVVAQLLTSHLEGQLSPQEAMGKAMERLRGAFALVALFSGRHDILLGARRGSSLAVGYGNGEMYIGTDALALAPFTKRVTYLEDDDWVVLSARDAKILQGHAEVKREIRESGITGAMMGKGNHRHFMLKEIYEQPAVIGDTLHIEPRLARDQPADLAVRLDKGFAPHHHRLWHGVLRRHGGEVLVRETGAPTGRGRGRLRTALSRAAAARGRCLHGHFAVGRDRRYAGGSALCQGAGADHRVGRERARKRHRPRIRHRAAHTRRPGDRRRLDQGLHHATHRAAGHRHRCGPRARHALRRR